MSTEPPLLNHTTFQTRPEPLGRQGKPLPMAQPPKEQRRREVGQTPRPSAAVSVDKTLAPEAKGPHPELIALIRALGRDAARADYAARKTFPEDD